jgi:hypothetical protein
MLPPPDQKKKAADSEEYEPEEEEEEEEEEEADEDDAIEPSGTRVKPGEGRLPVSFHIIAPIVSMANIIMMIVQVRYRSYQNSQGQGKDQGQASTAGKTSGNSPPVVLY